jgi:hypothetical protein
MLLVLMLSGCKGDAPREAATRESDASALLATWLPVRLGASLADARAALPGLAATGWQSGTRATWVTSHAGATVELETDAEQLTRATLELGGPQADAAEARLRELGPAVDCSPLPGGISDFRPRLWKLAGGGSVTAIRKRSRLVLEVREPAEPDFDAQLERCKREHLESP